MKCSGCFKVTKDGNSIKCTSHTCDKNFCSLCINASSFSTDRKKNWKCPDCSAVQKKGGDNSLTPVRPALEPQNITMRRKVEGSSDSAESEMKELTAVITRLTSEFSSLKTKLEEVTHSLCHSHERMDELVRSMSANDTRLINLEKRDHEVVNLQATVSLLQNELNVQAQHNLRNEIEILGIPEINSENLDQIVKVAAQKVGVQLRDEDVDWITRVGPRRPSVTASLPTGSNRMPRPVVVRLLRRTKRDQILRASKSRKNLSSTDLDITGDPARVFFNERLTRDNRILFRVARNTAKAHGYAFCWCNQGAIYIRQREGKPAVLIRSQDDLDRILPPTSNDHNGSS